MQNGISWGVSGHEIVVGATLQLLSLSLTTCVLIRQEHLG